MGAASNNGNNNDNNNNGSADPASPSSSSNSTSSTGPRRDGPRKPRPSSPSLGALPPALALPLAELRAYALRLSHLRGSLVPMASLFFLLSFVNTLLDSLKDTLIITSVGGGAHVLPFLSLYAVLPCSVLFLVMYALATQRLSRAAVFNVIVGGFAAFFAAFGLFLHPNADALHGGGASAALASFLARSLPAGLDGAVGMVRNWAFTLFYCAGELWGDVCMGLCFWTLANDTTALSDAPTLYPLLGVGANVAQAVAGMLLRGWNNNVGGASAAAASSAAASSSSSSAAAAAVADASAAANAAAADFVSQTRALMMVVVVLCGAALVLHAWIARRFAEAAARSQAEAAAADAAEELAARQAAARAEALAGDSRRAAAAAAFALSTGDEQAMGEAEGAAREAERAAMEAAADADARRRRVERRRRRKLRGDPRESGMGMTTTTAGSSSSSSSGSEEEEEEDQESEAAAAAAASASGGAATPTTPPAAAAKPRKPPLRETFALLAASVEIRCLAVMSLAQGLCSSLVEFCWKSHLRLLYPSPADFSAYLGGVAVWTGATTCALMLVSPVLFDRLGWRGVAGATPRVLAYGGGLFFVACIAYQHLHGAAAQAAAQAAAAATTAAASAAASAAAPPGAALLKLLVASGAVLFVFSRGAKFSLFKPAEEMVYVTLGEQARTKGKAAIDVVGSQAGKSGGSLLQQALLLVSAGSLTGIVPPMAAIFLLMLHGWRGAVDRLAVAREAQLAAVRHNLDLTVDDEEGGGEVTRAAEAAIAAAAKAAGGGPGGGLVGAPPRAPPPPPAAAPAA
jgi:ATP:ADP antiporter, AAA family